MTHIAILFVISLFFSAGLGFIVAAANAVTFGGHDPADHGAGQAMQLVLHPDAPESVNLQMALTDFRFAPEAVNTAHVHSEGHAQIYVNGAKIARAYGPWHQITGLSGGEDIRVTLNANAHRKLFAGDIPIAVSVTAPDF